MNTREGPDELLIMSLDIIEACIDKVLELEEENQSLHEVLREVVDLLWKYGAREVLGGDVK